MSRRRERRSWWSSSQNTKSAKSCSIRQTCSRNLATISGIFRCTTRRKTTVASSRRCFNTSTDPVKSISPKQSIRVFHGVFFRTELLKTQQRKEYSCFSRTYHPRLSSVKGLQVTSFPLFGLRLPHNSEFIVFLSICKRVFSQFLVRPMKLPTMPIVCWLCS